MYRLNKSSFGVAEFSRQIFLAVIHPETPFEAIFDPFFWTNVAKNINIGDKIEVLAEDNTYYAELIVTNCSPQWVKVKLLLDKVSLCDDGTAEPDGPEVGFDVRWRGPKVKWGVVKKEGNIVLQENLSTRDDAQRWLNEYLKSMGM